MIFPDFKLLATIFFFKLQFKENMLVIDSRFVICVRLGYLLASLLSMLARSEVGRNPGENMLRDF